MEPARYMYPEAGMEGRNDGRDERILDRFIRQTDKIMYLPTGRIQYNTLHNLESIIVLYIELSINYDRVNIPRYQERNIS